MSHDVRKIRRLWREKFWIENVRTLDNLNNNNNNNKALFNSEDSMVQDILKEKSVIL